MRSEAAGMAGFRLLEFFVGLGRERRGSGGADLVTLTASTPVLDDAGNERLLDDYELAQRCIEMVVAGHETTAKLIAGMLFQLAEHPDQRALVAADLSLAPEAVAETLRYNAPVQYHLRTVAEEVEFHGTRLPAGSRVVLLNGSANRDPRFFDAPDVFDVRREDKRHLGFGVGTHRCLGFRLAALESRVALEEVLTRFPDYSVDREGVAHTRSSNIRGISALPVLL